MTKNTHPLHGLKYQKHIDQVLRRLDVYIAQYRVPQPKLLREATAQLIASNLGPRYAFYYDIQDEIYWLIYHKVEFLIKLEIQQEQEQLQEKQNLNEKIQTLTSQRNPSRKSQKSKIILYPLVDLYNIVPPTSLNSLTALKTSSLNSISHPPP